MRAEVEQKWDEYAYSTNKEWVEYDEGKDTRSRVNFEDGEIEVSTLVPVEEMDHEAKAATPYGTKVPTPEAKPVPLELKPEQEQKITAQAQEKIKQQVIEIFSAKNEVKSEVLADQVKDAGGKVVTPQNVEQYVEKQVVPQILVDKKPVAGKDGQQRIKVTAKIKMTPDHLQIRADKFKPQVKEYADKYQLDPALILAVIHTESYFNPLAKSRIPAYGLMQLVPRSGALEAYHYLYKEKKILPADYLYQAENHILLGTVYLHLLYDKYFGRIKNTDNRRSLSIAAYNCGPTRLTKNIVGKHNVDNMANGDFVELIRQTVPAETKDYILKVQQRIPLYDDKVSFIYEDNGVPHQMWDGMSLRSRLDYYSVYFSPEQDCYVYIYQVDSSGAVYQIFPNLEYGNVWNPVKKGKDYWIPNDDRFYLDDVTGEEKIYFFAAKEPAKELETLFAQLKQTSSKQAVASIQGQIKGLLYTRGIGGHGESGASHPVIAKSGNTFDLISRKMESVGAEFMYCLTFRHVGAYR
ncbi:MAG: transglycosylase SLT domain-containing protein [Candidatus Schekmanbacteria bacterium]|nr:transglycosylase SLT domain-containing protein [Candidatus Schekmanbacteria bacterium]